MAVWTLCLTPRARSQGRRSRSLVAIYKMLNDGGFTEVFHVSGGIREWCVRCCWQRSLLTSSDIGRRSLQQLTLVNRPPFSRRATKELPLVGSNVEAWRVKAGQMPQA